MVQSQSHTANSLLVFVVVRLFRTRHFITSTAISCNGTFLPRGRWLWHFTKRCRRSNTCLCLCLSDGSTPDGILEHLLPHELVCWPLILNAEACMFLLLEAPDLLQTQPVLGSMLSVLRCLAAEGMKSCGDRDQTTAQRIRTRHSIPSRRSFRRQAGGTVIFSDLPSCCLHSCIDSAAMPWSLLLNRGRHRPNRHGVARDRCWSLGGPPWTSLRGFRRDTGLWRQVDDGLDIHVEWRSRRFE